MRQGIDLMGISRIEIENLATERAYSRKWGTSFDDKNTLNDWVTYITMYATESAKIGIKNDSKAIYKKLIKSANLVLLAAERVRKGTIAPRHYDRTPTAEGTRPGGDGIPLDSGPLEEVSLDRVTL